MGTIKRYENYPAATVMLSGLVALSIYTLGFLVILRTGFIYSVIYLLYILVLEYRLVKNHCTDCYYWGKTCAFGRGRISALFFRKHTQSRFCSKQMTWKDILPDFLVSLVPLVTGIIILILLFDFALLVSLLLLVLLTTIGNGFVRGTLACKYCKQKDLGCPADALFNKKK